jgi:hypothetical protein
MRASLAIIHPTLSARQAFTNYLENGGTLEVTGSTHNDTTASSYYHRVPYPTESESTQSYFHNSYLSGSIAGAPFVGSELNASWSVR